MRNVFTIIDDLAAGLAELKAALQPLGALRAVPAPELNGAHAE